MGDTLSPSSITDNLATGFIGKRVLYYPRLASTMDVAKQEARRGAAEGTVIITDEQTAGKGRMQRTFLSPPGSIALSVILYPGVSYLPYLVMLASLAVARSIKTVTGLEPQLKWPNDVIVNGKKVCGILVESEVRGSVVESAVIGIGINVNFRLSDFPEILPFATSLSDELGENVSRLDIIRCLLVELERLYLSAGEAIYRDWRDRLATLGREVRVRSGESIYEGIAESVAEDGSLLLRRSDGSLTKIVAGDVTLRDQK